jgi:hypothetical protein
VSDVAQALEASQTAEHSLGNTIPNLSGGFASSHLSVVPARDRLLHSDPVALQPVARRRGLTMVGLVGFILGVASTAALTNVRLRDWSEWALGGTFEPASSWSPHIGIQDNSAIPHLIAWPSHGLSGEPIPLALEVHGPAEGARVIITGLLPGMDLSAGEALGSNTWQVRATDLSYGWVAPPKDFVGSANLVAELRSTNNKIADRQVLHLEWLPSTSTPALRDVAESPNLPPVVRPASHEQAAQVSSNPGEPAQHQANQQLLTTAGDEGTSRASEGSVATDAVSKDIILQSLPPVNAKKAGRTRDHRRIVAQRNRRDGQAVTSPGTKSLPADSKDTRHAASEGLPVLKGFWDWSR